MATPKSPKPIKPEVNSSSSETTAQKPQKRTDALPPPPPEEICKILGQKTLTIDWLAGDGSDRCYYRLSFPDLAETLVLMQLSEQDAKALRENGYDWINIGEILRKNNIFVPKVIATIPNYAALIIEDYGNTMMETKVLKHLQDNQIDAVNDIYVHSFEILANFLKIAKDKNAVWCQRSFDKERFLWEMMFFMKNYIEPVAAIKFSPHELDRFKQEAEHLSEFLAGYSHWFVHRDFHSRNIMYKNGSLAVIDFQDARLGPSAYDLVSLCFDSYTFLRPDIRMNLFEKALNVINKNVGISVTKEICEHWKPMLLQRQLKAIGSFGYLSIQKNRGNYLKYVKPALSTLEKSIVYDKRWPFLSDTLIGYLNGSLPEEEKPC